ncbi:F-box protein At5g10340 [Eutrema salsugineum]|uniref:F-box protein At5g10340 n=1 Tax=Eutrema salsugineum TaxID=72664 RepID=UPI000CECFDA4|nr:F-box protein At5g10340 [Eutrema salsugineum]
MQSLPHDVIEHILERLDVKTLLKFNAVSKQWKSTIQSPFFKKRHLLHRKQSRDPEVLLVSVFDLSVNNPQIEALRTLVLRSSVSVKIPTTWEKKCYNVCNSSCDGLICLYDSYESCIIINPTTRWHRTLPPCNYQLVYFEIRNPRSSPGFGKDKISDTYKPVWLYNSDVLGLNNNATTTCEVYDFTTNSWRYVVPASPYLILHCQYPVHLDGSLHWFTAPDEGENKILSFILHAETFQIISKAPFVHDSIEKIVMCNLDDHLCVSEIKWPNQVIWSLDSDHKTWTKIYSIDLYETSLWFGEDPKWALKPLAVLEKDKLLLYEGEWYPLVIHDPITKGYDIAYTSRFYAYAICYFPSLISILSS